MLGFAPSALAEIAKMETTRTPMTPETPGTVFHSEGSMGQILRQGMSCLFKRFARSLPNGRRAGREVIDCRKARNDR